MSDASRVAALAARLSSVAQLLSEAESDVRALSGGATEATAREALAQWLPGIDDAIQRMQLDCVDARFATRELRDALPGTTVLQPRLL